MTPFKAAAILAMLLAGAGSARAGTIVTIIDPTNFGGFETAGETAAQWAPTAGFPTATLTITTTGSHYFPGNATHYASIQTGGVAAGWQFVGLQNLSVTPGDVVTFSAEVWGGLANDKIGLNYGPAGSVTLSTPPADAQTLAGGGYQLETFTFTPTTSTIDIDIGFLQTNSGASWMDVVSVTQDIPGSIPEPASMALLGAALFGLGLVRRKFG